MPSLEILKDTASGNIVKSEMFGGNYTFQNNFNSSNPDGNAMPEEHLQGSSDMLGGINTWRYPGGSVAEEHFDIFDWNSDTSKSKPSEKITPLDDFFDVVGPGGRVAIVIPTLDALINPQIDGSGKEIYDTHEIDPAYIAQVGVFVAAALELAADKGVTITAFEIGNEFFRRPISGTQYGELAADMAVAIQEAQDDFDSANNSASVTQASILVQSTITNTDVNANPVESAREELNNLIDAFKNSSNAAAAAAAVDGVVDHYYAKLKADINDGDQDFFFQQMERWETKLGKTLEKHVTEWNFHNDKKAGVGGVEVEKLWGLKEASLLVEMMYRMVDEGIDVAQVWPIWTSAKENTSLVVSKTTQADGVHPLEIKHGGAAFLMMNESIIGLKTAGSDDLSDDVGGIAGADVEYHAFSNDQNRDVIFITNQSAASIEESVDISSFTAGYGSAYFVSLKIVGDDALSDADNATMAHAAVEWSGESWNGANIITLSLADWEVARLEITDITQNADTIRGSMGHDLIASLGGHDSVTGGDGNDTLLGGEGNDRLYGGTGDDILNGGAGADIIDGGEGTDSARYNTATGDVWVDLASQGDNKGEADGDQYNSIENLFGSNYNDTLRGDDQNNEIKGHGGNDVLEGREGNDTLLGDVGNDQLDGDNGADNLWGGEGIDTLFGEAGNDRLYGGAGNDILNGGVGADTIDGGEGTDSARYSTSTGSVLVDLVSHGLNQGEAAGDIFVSIENLVGSNYNDTLRGDDQINQISGYGGDDVVFGNGGNDRLYGGSGNDILLGGSGADIIDGGEGIDRAQYHTANAGVLVDLENQSANQGDAAGDQYNLIENLFGSSHNDTLRGDGGDNDIWGYFGNDVIYGRAGNDTLRGQVGNDVLFGGEGHDALHGDEGNDILAGDAGNDSLYGGAGDDILRGGDGADSLNGGEGTDSARYILADSAVSADLTNQDNNSGDAAGDQYYSIENLFGSVHNDSLRGDDLNNKITGFNGNDVVHAEGGSDSVLGGLGNDELHGENGADTLWGEDGIDTLFGGAGSDGLFGGVGDDILNGGVGADTIHGGEGTDRAQYSGAEFAVLVDLDDQSINVGDAAGDQFFLIENLFGSGHNDSLRGDSADNYIWGYNGDDEVYARDGNDTLLGQNGDDNLHGQNGVDALYGDAGSDTLFGEAGNDRLYGGAGNDILLGGLGNDLLEGGAGGDRFIFSGQFGQDQIADFTLAEIGEVIDLSLNSGITGFSDLVLTQNGLHTLIDIGNGNTIQLNNIVHSQLSSGDFDFA